MSRLTNILPKTCLQNCSWVTTRTKLTKKMIRPILFTRRPTVTVAISKAAGLKSPAKTKVLITLAKIQRGRSPRLPVKFHRSLKNWAARIWCHLKTRDMAEIIIIFTLPKSWSQTTSTSTSSCCTWNSKVSPWIPSLFFAKMGKSLLMSVSKLWMSPYWQPNFSQWPL